MVKEPQRSSEVVDGPSNSTLEPFEGSKISFNERKQKQNFKSTYRKQGGFKKAQSNIVNLKKISQQSPHVVQVLKKKRRRPMKDAFDKSGRLSPRQKFAVFKPPAESKLTGVMHPTQKEAEMKEYQPDNQPILKIQVEKLAPENGVNGKAAEQPEPVIQIENEAKVENNGHGYHDVIDHEEEIVDMVAISEAEGVPVIPEAEEAPAYEDIGNGIPEEPLMSPRLRGSAKKGPSSTRSSSPADSLHKERTSRKLNYVQPAEVPVEEKVELSVVADLDEPLIVEGGAEDLEVSAAAPVVSEKSAVKLKTPVKATSPSRSKKTLKLPATPVEEEGSGRRGRKPKSDEKKKLLEEDASPRASMSLMEDTDEYKPLSGRAGSAIRSVRARRPMRRSRNISALDSSLHNQSSPWDEEYKVLSPRSGVTSMINTSLVNGDESPLSVSVAQKRKVSEDELDTQDTKKAKNETSHTSSFFSIVTSPICALKEKFRGGALSSSTPFHGVERKPVVESDASMLSAEENGAEDHAEETKNASPTVAVPAKSWCALM